MLVLHNKHSSSFWTPAYAAHFEKHSSACIKKKKNKSSIAQRVIVI